MIDWLAPLRRVRMAFCNWFSLTRSEAASLLLVLGIVLLGIVAKLYWGWHG